MPDSENSFDPSKFQFNFTIHHPEDATKGIKTAWENGDRVFIFVTGITNGYLTATFNGTNWNTACVGIGPSALGASGTLHALYLPYGNDALPSYDNNQWTFNKGTDTYYFYAFNKAYTVEEVGEDFVVSATISMEKPETYVQFYIPYLEANETIQLACNALCPAGLASLNVNGYITENSGNAGAPVNGYAGTLAGEKGYYVSGKPVSEPGKDYYFVLKKGNTYSHYFKNRSAIQANKAYQLASYTTWPVVGSSHFVTVAGKRLETVNKGASHPWELGTPYGSTYEVPSVLEKLPDDADWNALQSAAAWKDMKIWDAQGSLVVAYSNYVFLPRSSSASSYYWSNGFASALQMSTDGTHSLIDSALPGEAYVRTLEKRDWFTIIATEDNTTVTFNYYAADDHIKFSRNNGIDWEDCDAGHHIFLLKQKGDRICFTGERTNYKNDSGDQWGTPGNKPIFDADQKVYIAGNIMSLLADKDNLSESAFHGAFSKGKNGNDEIEVKYIDISDDDPLILPATNLPPRCYTQMFRNCTKLTRVPAFRVETVGIRSCYNMFRNCSSLITTEGIELDAMELTEDCYRELFRGCSKITSIPILRAPTLAKSCYQQMLSGCTSLGTVVCLATNISASDCLNQWMSGIKSTGTLYQAHNGPFAPNKNGVPKDWIVKEYTE